MKTDLNEIYATVKDIFRSNTPPLRVSKDEAAAFEVSGTKEVMQGKKKVDGHYFGTTMLKPKDVRFYFFPVYTHVDEFADMPDCLRKTLKGKSCFYIKKMDEELEEAMKNAVAKGVELYQRDGLI